MKKLIILAITSLVGGAAFAQTSTPSTTPAISYGIKAGVNLPKFQFQDPNGTDPESKTTTNFHVTGYMDAPISSMFSIQPALSLQGKGGKFTFGNTVSEVNTLNIEIPVNLVAHIPMATGTGIYLGAGPYAAYAISGETKTTIGNAAEIKSDIDFGTDSGDDLKAFDLGVNFLGGFQFSNGLNLGAGYGLGLTDLRPTATSNSNSTGKITNRVWSFSAGIRF